MERTRIASPTLTAEIKHDGAELCSLRDAAGREYIWQALPAWPRHAPVLFPIVGRLEADTLRHAGQTYRLTQHGFARDRRFALVEHSATACRFRLEADDDTRSRYPFEFRFDVDYRLDGDTLAIGFTVGNPGPAPLPAAMGAHPAFCWPLAEGVAKDDHVITFSHAEPAPIRRVKSGLLLPDAEPTPVHGHTLRLHDGLFAADAVIFDQLASRALTFHAPGVPGLEISWEGLPQLALWMKPGAGFLCIEPWRGYASPQGWDGEFSDKPGVFHVAPGTDVSAVHRVRVLLCGAGGVAAALPLDPTKF